MKLRYVFLLIALLVSVAAGTGALVKRYAANFQDDEPPAIVHRPERLIPPPMRPGGPRPAANARSRAKAKPRVQTEPAPPVAHEPARPKTGDPILVTVDLNGRDRFGASPLLEYQLVEPGKYVALQDPAYEKGWTVLRMNDAGTQGDKRAGDRVFSAELPGNLQKHRWLVRYRIRSGEGGKLIAPNAEDPQPNYAYFVYDGVPPWKGAVNPKSGDPDLRQPVEFPSSALDRVAVYHFISSKSAVEKVMWTEQSYMGDGDRHAYRYTGTLVYDGVVYDHVGFRARGGGWRHAMGKNMWKFNFLPGHRFEARDFYGRPYKAKWDKLNLGACIQQADYNMRGEQGMFEAVGFRLFNLAGTEAPVTHWVHLRVIDAAEENPPNQYSGDFWGLYLAVENIDEHFLKEHSLPTGSLYKMDFGPKPVVEEEPGTPGRGNIHEFTSLSMGRQQSPDWWRTNVDLPRYYSYRTILECIHHYDVDSGKNYFYYHNPKSGQWVTLPWDIDLSWGDQMFGGGFEPFFRAGILSRAPFKREYQERVAELRDLLFNPDETGRLIDEHSRMIWDPSGAPSLVDADRAKWDYNPILASRYVMDMKAGQGRFYFGRPKSNFATMVKYMKNYTARRATWMDARILASYRPPEAPKVASLGPEPLKNPSLQVAPGQTAFARYRFRLAEITKPGNPGFNPREPWKYEIQAIWEKEGDGKDPVPLPTGMLLPGHTYRARARGQEASGAWSRWSAPLEFTVPAQ